MTNQTRRTSLDAESAAQWRQWAAAVAEPDCDRAVGELYDRVDAAVAERGPACRASGRCCHFDTWGHRLYVTGLEIAWLLNRLDAEPRRTLVESRAEIADFDGCLFQVDRLCRVHRIRPLGCRLFFCDRDSSDWQHAAYERFLHDLQRLHERLGLPYRYLEWRAGLREAASVIDRPVPAKLCGHETDRRS
jgi:Fe-S-cluster containining protein